MVHDTVIVGGGMAGLTAAAFLRKAGKTVLLLEKNDQCGGLVRSFSRKGFTFDAGVRALLDSGIIFPMLKELGLSLEVSRSKVSLGIEDSFIDVESPEDLAAYERLLASKYPENAADVEKIVRFIRKVMKDMDVLYGVENPMFGRLLEDPGYLVGTLLPWLIRFAGTIGRIYRLGGPVEEFLGRMTGNRSLQDIIDQHFFRKTPTFFAMSYFSLYLGYLYPPGGTGVLAETLESHVREQGTEIRTGSRVVGIDPQARLVRDEAGHVHGYRELLWAADLKTLYAITDAEALAGTRQQARFLEKKAELGPHRGGDSVFTLFLGVELPPDYFAAISHGHLFYTPDRQGLGDIHRAELAGLLGKLEGQLDPPGQPARKAMVLDWLGRFFPLTSYEISIPALRFASMAPDGKTGLIISVLFEYRLCALVRADGWFDEFRIAVESAIVKVVGEKLYPGLEGHIIDRFSSSPLTIEREVGTNGGAITGWAFTGGRLPAVQKIQESTRAVRTALPHVHQAGQWTYSPSGVPIAILTGKLAANAILKALRRKGRSASPASPSPSAPQTRAPAGTARPESP